LNQQGYSYSITWSFLQARKIFFDFSSQVLIIFTDGLDEPVEDLLPAVGSLKTSGTVTKQPLISLGTLCFVQ